MQPNQLILEGRVHRTEKKRKKYSFLFYRREFLEHSNDTDIRWNLRKFSIGLWNFQIAIINLNPWYNQMKSEKWSKNQFLLFFGISWWTNWLLQEGLAMVSGKNGLQYSNMVPRRSYNRMLDIRKHPQSLDIIKSSRRSTKKYKKCWFFKDLRADLIIARLWGWFRMSSTRLYLLFDTIFEYCKPFYR